jgi:hypothetical protein
MLILLFVRRNNLIRYNHEAELLSNDISRLFSETSLYYTSSGDKTESSCVIV